MPFNHDLNKEAQEVIFYREIKQIISSKSCF